MSDNNFTPGPWFATGCDVKPLRDSPYICWTGTSERRMDEAKANANLISAAPEMYEALMMAVSFIEEELESRECSGLADDSEYIAGPRNLLNQIDRVLRKARGEGGF